MKNDASLNPWFNIDHAKLMKVYKTTEFFVETDTRDWMPLIWAKEPMAVITAFNPFGQKTRFRDNRIANDRLYELLVSKGIYPVRAKGQSPDGRHIEMGWLVPFTDQRTITNIAFFFKQMAVYVVTDKDRYIHWTINRAPSPLPKVKRR